MGIGRAAVFGVALAATVGVWAGASVAAPLEAYGRLPQIEEAQISPDGTMIALSLTDGEQRSVVVRRVESPAPTVMLRAGDQKLRGLQWAGSGHLLISSSITGTIRDVISARSEWFGTQDYNLASRRMRNVFRNSRSNNEGLNITAMGPWVIAGQPQATVVMGGIEFVEGDGRLSLFRTDLETDHTQTVETGGPETHDWVVDEAGAALAALDIGPTGLWSIRVHGAGRWRAAAQGPDYSSGPNLLGQGRDGRTVIVSGEEGEQGTVRELNTETGAWGEPMVGGETARPLFDPATGRMNGVITTAGDSSVRTFFDAQDQRRWNGMTRAFPGQRITDVSFSADHSRALALVDSPTDGPAYALVDFTTGRATWIGGQYRGIGPGDVSPVRYITYNAADGLEIGAYLTLPRGQDAHHLPLVVLPHGGPESHDTAGFDWWAQALASRGYAVLQPNFRGSSGYGAAFVHAGFGEWGRKMQTDLSDGVRFLAHEGTIDLARVCIVGASYGGYAALAGVTIDRGVYRCAASVGGVADPAALIRDAGTNRGVLAQRYWAEFMGVTGQRDPALTAISPLAQAARADAPILLVHGRDDTVVPFSQSANMAAALQRAGRPVQLVDLRSEDHWLSRGATRLLMLTEVVRFLETHNPPGAAPAATAPHS